MRKEILDIRTLVTIVLVVASLAGHRWSSIKVSKSDTQNLNFIKTDVHNINRGTSSVTNLSLGGEYERFQDNLFHTPFSK